MSTTTSGSVNIAVLDSKIVADLCAGVFLIDITPSTFIDAGASNMLGFSVKITNPFGVVFKDFPTAGTFDSTDILAGVVSVNIPTKAGNYQYGRYIFEVKITDANISAGGGISGFNTLVGGDTYTDGTYTNIALVGGTGINATADFVVASGVVTSVTPATTGQGYISGDVLTINDADLGGGSGFQITVDTITSTVSGLSYTTSKDVTISEPNPKDKTKKFGSLSAKLDGVCKDGKLYVQTDGVPTYRGVISDDQVNDMTLEYPTSSALAVLSTQEVSFSAVLFEGQYKWKGTICANYDLGDNVSAKVNYKVKREKIIRCLIDEECIAQQLIDLSVRLKSDCTDAEKAATQDIILNTFRLTKTIEVLTNAGFDASDYVSELEDLLGCPCTCNCAEGTPIINTNPAKDFSITGCNVEKTTVGLTDNYVIDNYIYTVSVQPNGSVLTIGVATLDGCTQTQPLIFDIAKAYIQIKNLANTSTGEDAFWASISNKTLDTLDVSCFGLTPEQWLPLSFAERFQYMINQACAGGSCDAEISTNAVTQGTGAGIGDAILTWTNVSGVYEVSVYLDGIWQGDVLDPVATFRLVGAANGVLRTYTIVAKCDNGSVGTTLTGTFTYTNTLFTGTFRIGANLMPSSDIHPVSPAVNTTTGVVSSISDSQVDVVLDLVLYDFSDPTDIDSSYNFPSGLTVDSSVAVNGKWVVNAHYDGTANRTFTINPPVIAAFLYSGTPIANDKILPTSPAFEGTSGAGFVYSNTNPALVTLRFPYNDVGGTPDFASTHIVPAGLTITSASVDGAEWVVNVSYDGTVAHTFAFGLPVYISVFKKAGVGIPNGYVDILTGGVRWEDVNDPPYNFGYESNPMASVSLRFNANAFPKTGAAFTDDYIVPAGVMIDSTTVSGSYWIVTLHYPATGNHIYDFLNNV